MSYKLAYALNRGGETFEGQIEIKFSVGADFVKADDIFVDYKGKYVRRLEINGNKVTQGNPFRDHRIYFEPKYLQAGENHVLIRFTSSYNRDCAGVQYFKDDDDGEEYLYSDHEPASAHKGFPCFDQPDLKATYTFMTIVPKSWTVFANALQVGDSAVIGTDEYKNRLHSFGIDATEFTSGFDDEPLHAFEFEESPKISTYLYCFIAGPYATILSDQEVIKNYRYPLRLQCRKSLAKYLETSKEMYFTTTMCGIDFYEKLFSTNYPWSKLDQAFVPDYSMGAMENVGIVVYRDEYIERSEELFSETKKENIMNTFLHEISHMWFGNFVTMKWWDDLWLNESFANFVSYICLDEAPGLEQWKNAWSIFLDESFWGLSEDQKDTTHCIGCDVTHTEQAADIFDGISYGKGASWLNQTHRFFGRTVFKAGIASYFKEFGMKNASLDDFIGHFSRAAKAENCKVDFESWSHTWLKTAGCCEIWHEIEEEGGKIKKFEVVQKVWRHGENNRLREQLYEVAFYDKDMKVTKIVEIITKSDQERFEVAELAGTEAPFAYHINYKNYGYAKFKIDDKSIKVFE